MRVEAVRDPSRLRQYADLWEDLAQAAIEPNVFFEPWLALPALEHFDRMAEAEFVLVFGRPDGFLSGPEMLCGLFPLTRKPRYKGLPIPLLKSWSYPECSLSTPLIRADRARASITAFFDWLAEDPAAKGLVEFDGVTGDGPFAAVLMDYLDQSRRHPYIIAPFDRAFLRKGKSADAYLKAGISRRGRQNLRRRERRLAELGRLEFVELGSDDNIDSWVDRFVDLEARGWKGRTGVAMARRDVARSVFVTAIRSAFQRRRLLMTSLRLNGMDIALRISLLAPPGSFALKTTYDEAFSRYSPGTLLEIANIRQFHTRDDLQWMDSCAGTNNFMMNHLWIDRRSMASILIGDGLSPGGLIVRALPGLRKLKRRYRTLIGVQF